MYNDLISTQLSRVIQSYSEALTNRSYLLFEKGQFEAALGDAESCILDAKDKALPLISLYALGRISEIYKRIEIQSAFKKTFGTEIYTCWLQKISLLLACFITSFDQSFTSPDLFQPH